MNQPQPNCQPAPWRPLLNQARNLLTQETIDLKHWLDSQGDLLTLRLVWRHYYDSWTELAERMTDPLLIDFCRRQADRASVELQQWYFNVEGAI